MSTKLFGFTLSLFSLARCFLVATSYLSMSVIIYHGGNACFSKRQHWKRWPKLFLRPCPMLLWWLECSLCISIGRVWTTLVHKASAVPDMSMWRGLHMIATWKMASEQLGNKCYQYRTCHTCCFQKTMGNDRQTAEEWNFGTWLDAGSECWLAPGAQLQGRDQGIGKCWSAPCATATPRAEEPSPPVLADFHENFGANIPVVCLISLVLRKPRHRLELRKDSHLLFNPSLNA